MAFLKVIKGLFAGQVVALRSDKTILGRHPSSQVVLEDGAVSRHHAEIVCENGTYFIQDLQSRNGTEVNNTKVTGRYELKDGDGIRVCDHAFQFCLQPDSDSTRKKLFIGTTAVPPGAGTIDDNDEDDPRLGHKITPPSFDAVGGNDGSSVLSALEASSTGRNLRLGVRSEVKLRAILDISTALGRVINLNDVLPAILKSLIKIFPQADAGFVLLEDPESRRLRIRASLCNPPNDDEVPVSMTVVRQAMEQTKAILSADVMGDRRFRSSESLSELKLRSLMCAPLLTTDGRAMGVIQLSTVDGTQPFSPDDLDLLASVSAQAALAVENAALHDAVLHRRDLERDMEFAAQVQQGFLPNHHPKIDGFEFADYYKAAYHVGGDYFDYVRLPNGRLAVAVGDVAGKGVSAALLMARLHASARYHLLSATSAAEAMMSLNTDISGSGLGFRLITLVFAIIDPATKEISIANAGHLPPLLHASDGTAHLIGMSESGLPLGVLAKNEYGELKLQLKPGESLLFYTDGITEAMNSSEEMYGKQRLLDVGSKKYSSIDAQVGSLIKSVERFCGEAPQRDDICVAAVRRISS